MKNCLKSTLLLLSFIMTSLCYSQNLGGSIELEYYKYSVKQIGEFMERFNMQETLVDSNDVQWKQKNLTLLFDRDTYFKMKYVADDFIRKVTTDSVTLHYNSPNWYAEAECKAKFKGTTQTITLYLMVEQIEHEMYKWTIVGAHGDLLQLKPDNTNPGLKISPVDNELNFMSLNHITTTESRNIKNYVAKQFEIDELSVLITLIHQQVLSIEYVQKLTYHFMNVAGYDFDVQYYERNTVNAGWLISNIKINE